MKKLISVFLTAAITAATLSGCQSGGASDALTPVTLNEVAHSIFYAPQYAAIELGYFKDEGIDLTLVNGAGADKVMTALISGDADIGFMGSEASIYVYQEGSDDYAVNFAQLTQRAGNFLVGRTPQENFSWQDLMGKKVLGGRAGGRPNHDVTFEHIREIYEWTIPQVPFNKSIILQIYNGRQNKRMHLKLSEVCCIPLNHYIKLYSVTIFSRPVVTSVKYS